MADGTQLDMFPPLTALNPYQLNCHRIREGSGYYDRCPQARPHPERIRLAIEAERQRWAAKRGSFSNG